MRPGWPSIRTSVAPFACSATNAPSPLTVIPYQLSKLGKHRRQRHAAGLSTCPSSWLVEEEAHSIASPVAQPCSHAFFLSGIFFGGTGGWRRRSAQSAGEPRDSDTVKQMPTSSARWPPARGQQGGALCSSTGRGLLFGSSRLPEYDWPAFGADTMLRPFPEPDLPRARAGISP